MFLKLTNAFSVKLIKKTDTNRETINYSRVFLKFFGKYFYKKFCENVTSASLLKKSLFWKGCGFHLFLLLNYYFKTQSISRPYYVGNLNLMTKKEWEMATKFVIIFVREEANEYALEGRFQKWFWWRLSTFIYWSITIGSEFFTKCYFHKYWVGLIASLKTLWAEATCTLNERSKKKFQIFLFTFSYLSRICFQLWLVCLILT